MAKELFISTTPHETKVAVVDDEQLSEIYFERENEYTLAGSIYKGRVTRVLPGMQSAFVDIGLERDAFLYVSDFFEMEDEEESFDSIPAARPFEINPEVRGEVPAEFRTEPAHESLATERDEDTEQDGQDADPSDSANRQELNDGTRRWRGRRRGRRGRGRGLPESKFAQPSGTEAAPEEVEETLGASEPQVGAPYAPVILPGESLAKFKRQEPQPVEATDDVEA